MGVPVLETVKALAAKLDESQHRLDRLDRYYDGRQGLQLGSPAFARAYDGRLASLCSNFLRIVVDSVAERLAVVGFRLAGAEDADANLWNVWQANDLDEGSQLAHTEALVHGRSFLSVWAGPDGAPTIAVESARQVVVQHDPSTRLRTAAWKQWRADGYAFATLYLPDEVHRLRSTSKVSDGAPATAWEPRGPVVPNPLGVPPIVPMVNHGRLLDLEHGASELDAVMPMQDLLNRALADVVVSAEHASLPRRWATGLEIPTDPETGQPVEPFDQGGRLWLAESEGAKFGAFPETDVSALLGVVEMCVQHIGSLSATPPHYLLPHKGGPASAESIKSSEASLVAKVRRRQLSFGASWEEAMRLALAVQLGAVPAGAESMETVWADPETRSLAQSADAAVKRKDVGVPWRQLMEDLGYSPVQIDRMADQRRQDGDGLDLQALLRG